MAVVALIAVGAFAGARFLERSNAALREAHAETARLRDQVTQLDRQVVELGARMDELRSQASALQTRLDGRDRAIADLTARLDRSVPIGQHAELRSRFDAMERGYENLLEQTSSLVPVRTPELRGDALFLDRSVPGVTYTGSVCSGSMEPNITCDDLLILYQASVTDLDAGDIIYFRRQNADCSGHTERYMLHRIRRVVAAPTGLSFETKGDALAAPDACLVPSGDVLYKLLTNVRSARIVG